MTNTYIASSDFLHPNGDPTRTTGLENIGPDVNALNEFGMPPIHVAFYVGDEKEADAIMKMGAKLDTVFLKGNPMPLEGHIAYHVARGRTGIAQGLQKLLESHRAAEPFPANQDEARQRLQSYLRPSWLAQKTSVRPARDMKLPSGFAADLA